MEACLNWGQGDGGKKMRTELKAGVAALALMCLATNAWAASACAMPQDVMALRTAAVQQRLMVAALSCDAIILYNDFILTYQKDLQESDQALRNFFRRNNARTGVADYNAFKTKLANTSSIRSVGDMAAYCAEAKEAFSVALNEGGVPLAFFITAQPAATDSNFSACEMQLAGEPGSASPVSAPLPLSKPVMPVFPAQGASLGTGAGE